ncbi:MAG: hypothetical protein BWY50_01897 [Spirochaetes bacterium ADurb.Bin315]|nr:MAG: hypothetical protein BWY50_01897 [Spirochaetes bacterium ADurb.Bin315]
MEHLIEHLPLCNRLYDAHADGRFGRTVQRAKRCDQPGSGRVDGHRIFFQRPCGQAYRSDIGSERPRTRPFGRDGRRSAFQFAPRIRLDQSQSGSGDQRNGDQHDRRCAYRVSSPNDHRQRKRSDHDGNHPKEYSGSLRNTDCRAAVLHSDVLDDVDLSSGLARFLFPSFQDEFRP